MNGRTPTDFFGGIELMKAGKAKNIIFAGGNYPGKQMILSRKAKFTQDFGISAANIIVTKDIQNTKDEALAVRTILSLNNQKNNSCDVGISYGEYKEII